MNDVPRPDPAPSLMLAYLRLLRIPNVFTAVADIMTGFAFAAALSTHPTWLLLLLISSSSCLYLAGMVLNDVFDLEVDRRERPQRPLPSGMIARHHAVWLGSLLLLLGVVFGWTSGLVTHVSIQAWWRPGLIATMLAGTVLLYDGGLKRTLLGPIAMGACRLLNVLLGMSVDVRFASTFGFSTTQWLVAAGMGTYVAGITWFARHEATTSGRSGLVGAVALMLAGVTCLGLFPLLLGAQTRLTHESIWPILLGLLTLPVWRRCFLATLDPRPEKVQAAVKQAILSLIVLNAGLSMAVAGAGYGLAVLSLLVPSLILGRWIYST